MKYHGLKMEEVNDTMKHLWNKTYQGTGMFNLFPSSSIQSYTLLKISMGLKSYQTSKAVLRNAPTITGYFSPSKALIFSYHTQ